MTSEELREIVLIHLARFYDRRLKRLQDLRLCDILAKKNPLGLTQLTTPKADESRCLSPSRNGCTNQSYNGTNPRRYEVCKRNCVTPTPICFAPPE